MRAFFLILLLLTNCASFNGNTAQGWHWTSPSNTVSSSDIEIVVNITREVFEEVTGKKVVDSAFHNVKYLKFTYFETFCPPEDIYGSGKCLGQTDIESKEMWITLQGSCLARTSLVHELIHIFARNDHDHDNPLLFKKAPGPDEATVEHIAQDRAFVALGCTDIVLF